MLFAFEDRPSDSPLVERVWRSRTERPGVFRSVAASHWEMVVCCIAGETTLVVRGPETRPSEAFAAADGEWIGIRFRFGTFMPQLPVARLLDRQDVILPQATNAAFWLDGSAWEYPSFENAEAFVRRLERVGRIGREPLVDEVVHGQAQALSTRSAERRFLRATGLTHTAHRQIERARRAAILLQEGVPAADVVHAAGYFDQPHLSRALRRLVGQTPGQIARGERQLSFLYKTEPR